MGLIDSSRVNAAFIEASKEPSGYNCHLFPDGDLMAADGTDTQLQRGKRPAGHIPIIEENL